MSGEVHSRAKYDQLEAVICYSAHSWEHRSRACLRTQTSQFRSHREVTVAKWREEWMAYFARRKKAVGITPTRQEFYRP